ncbi:neuraminidase-like domain-containing protein [Pseudomonas sp. REB1044]|uniref:neuraminidase-like domain-containing protein n=1 Tax=Pseudomonas sp. REB1044 TaxID=2675224 RepID=UPI00315DF705
MLAWGEWEKITLTARGKITQTPLPAASATQAGDSLHAVDTVRPVIIAGRRYVVWVERDMSGIPMGGNNKPSVFHALRVCFSFQQTDGIWSPPNTFMTLDGHDRTGKFDDASVPDVYQHGAKGNQFLKTREFMPGLMVMVNIKGDRLDDPWLTVLLFDAAADVPTAPKPDVDYFIATKDLLLIEDKRLDTGEKTDHPLEARLVKQWLKFFRDPRVAQHPYKGAVAVLRYEEEGSSPFKWSFPADRGTANALATLADDGKSIVVDVDINAIRKAESRWKIYIDMEVAPVNPESTPRLLYICSESYSCFQSTINSANTVVEDTESEIHKQRIALNNKISSLTAQITEAEYNLTHTNLREKEDAKVFEERRSRAENRLAEVKSQKAPAQAALNTLLMRHYSLVEFNLSDSKTLDDIGFTRLKVTFMTPTKKTAVVDYTNRSSTIVVQNIFTPQAGNSSIRLKNGSFRYRRSQQSSPYPRP